MSTTTITGSRRCSTCRTPKPDADFGPSYATCSGCRERHARVREGRDLCDVWLVAGGQGCAGEPEVVFRAVCEHGHEMAGRSCCGCLASSKLGCLTCWTEQHHKCAVRFTEPAEMAAGALKAMESLA
jgi:hypothetical protein